LDGRAEAEDHLPLTKPVGIPPLKVDAGLDMVVGQYETVSFKGSVNCHEYIINYTWSFEYNETQHVLYGQSPSFTFSIPGIYVISFLVEDCFSRTYHDTLNVTVIVKLIPEADAGIDIYIDQHQTANFDASLSVVNEGIVNYSWNFYYRDAEIVLYGITSQYSFHAAGIFQVTLKVTDAEGNWDTDTLNVTVRDITPPIANAGLDITINQSDTVEFFFHQNSTDNVGIENWNWTFIYDGTKQTLFHSIIMSSLPFFTFDIPGNYTVTMNVSDEAGNWAIDTLNVTVLDNIVPVSDIWGEHTIEVNTTFQFNSSSCWDNVAIVNWTWKFEYGGERVFLYGPDPSFRFEIPGKYQVQLIVFDAERNAESSLMTITVEPGRTTPGDDDLEPADNGDKGEEKDRGIMAWIWLGLAVFLLSAVVVLLVFLIRSKKGGEEPAEEDEMGRVGKNEGVEDEG